ncbi:hypothetical protein [Streptomyces sedi]|uniref:hypothetical protein n=1 Tax=Streptomyces sedi TaxID=555059 RepID=UPI001476EDFF|nr:hypothetical protein [Streptomyces sedi]
MAVQNYKLGPWPCDEFGDYRVTGGSVRGASRRRTRRCARRKAKRASERLWRGELNS